MSAFSYCSSKRELNRAERVRSGSRDQPVVAKYARVLEHLTNSAIFFFSLVSLVPPVADQPRATCTFPSNSTPIPLPLQRFPVPLSSSCVEFELMSFSANPLNLDSPSTRTLLNARLFVSSVAILNGYKGHADPKSTCHALRHPRPGCWTSSVVSTTSTTLLVCG